MNPSLSAAATHPPIFGWRRMRVVIVASFALALLAQLTWTGSNLVLLLRLVAGGCFALLIFGLFERWPRRLPRWLARWALQVAGVALFHPFAMALIYWLTTFGESLPWYRVETRMGGYGLLTMFGILFGPWIAVAALLRQIKDEARKQALAFELERSEFERRELDSRLRLLQAQVEPHFLFNTLANVRELVESGSSRAAIVLEHLITYLRAAVPRLQDSTTTLAQEFELAGAYLEVMHMRMPDRLQFELRLEPAARSQHCPPMLLLTLVENAVRHGIDPAVRGGRITVRAGVDEARVWLEVADTGVGLQHAADGQGTGLANLRERLRLAFGDAARLDLQPNTPQGLRASVEWPLVRED
jgi:sensor histidine kinase YesM